MISLPRLPLQCETGSTHCPGKGLWYLFTQPPWFAGQGETLKGRRAWVRHMLFEQGQVPQIFSWAGLRVEVWPLFTSGLDFICYTEPKRSGEKMYWRATVHTVFFKGHFDKWFVSPKSHCLQFFLFNIFIVYLVSCISFKTHFFLFLIYFSFFGSYAYIHLFGAIVVILMFDVLLVHLSRVPGYIPVPVLGFTDEWWLTDRGGLWRRVWVQPLKETWPWRAQWGAVLGWPGVSVARALWVCCFERRESLEHGSAKGLELHSPHSPGPPAPVAGLATQSATRWRQLHPVSEGAGLWGRGDLDFNPRPKTD